eukprot:gene8481-17480_t
MEEEDNEKVDDYPSFHCSICLTLFNKPVSVACGHTFCKPCLKDCLNSKQICPMCRAPCARLAYQNAENLAISQFLHSKFPKYYRHLQEISDKQSVKISDVSQTETWTGHIFMLNYLLFPNQPGRIHIFENRYLVLFDRALIGDRKFIIHPKGFQNNLGIIVRIESYDRVGSTIHIQIMALQKCRFLHDSFAASVEDERMNLLTASVELINDTDFNQNESILELELEFFSRIRKAIPILLHTLPPEHRHLVEETAGVMPQPVQWQKWTLWLSCAIQMTKTERKELFIADNSVERVQMRRKIAEELFEGVWSSSSGGLPERSIFPSIFLIVVMMEHHLEIKPLAR